MTNLELEAGIQKLVAAITDEQGELRPITRIEFEIVGLQVRWSLWEGPVMLHTLTDRAERAEGFLEGTRDLLEMLAEDAERNLETEDQSENRR